MPLKNYQIPPEVAGYNSDAFKHHLLHGAACETENPFIVCCIDPTAAIGGRLYTNIPGFEQ